MEDFRLVQYLTTGQVIPTDSIIHRLDPRTRLLVFVGVLIALVSSHTVLGALADLALVAAMVVLARIPVRYALTGIVALTPWLLLVAVVQVAFGIGESPSCAVVVSIGPRSITWCSLEFAGTVLVRMRGLLLLMELLTWTSPIPGLVRGIEALAAPFDRLGLPAHELAMVGAIAIRFVPTMALEADRILKAQAARGADLQRGRLGVIRRVRRVLPTLVPLFTLALNRAERLAEAMESRAYSGGHGRGRYAQLHMNRLDWIVLFFVALFLMGMFAWTRISVLGG